MLQGGALLPDVTVREAVALVAAAHRRPMPVAEALRRARCEDIATRRVSKLSGGQLQRARFAVAVVSDPDLLVLDEPTAAMDVEARHVFWSSMREFTDAGRTVVFATHYLDEADTFADRIVILRDGRVVADGTPAAVKATAATRTVRFAGVAEDRTSRCAVCRGWWAWRRGTTPSRCAPTAVTTRSVPCSPRSRRRTTCRWSPRPWTTPSSPSPPTAPPPPPRAPPRRRVLA